VVLSLNSSFFRYSSCSSDIGYVPFFLVFVIMHFSCAACAMCYLKKHVALVMSPTSKSLCWASYLNCPAYDTILLASLIWTLLVVLFLFTYGCGKIYDRFLIYGLYTLTVTCRHATFFSAEWRKKNAAWICFSPTVFSDRVITWSVDSVLLKYLACLFTMIRFCPSLIIILKCYHLIKSELIYVLLFTKWATVNWLLSSNLNY
jgi:hypothetical protein